LIPVANGNEGFCLISRTCSKNLGNYFLPKAIENYFSLYLSIINGLQNAYKDKLFYHACIPVIMHLPCCDALVIYLELFSIFRLSGVRRLRLQRVFEREL
jgi:hypothetical protein